MANRPQLIDRWGKPVRRADLRREVAAPTVGGMRSPLSGYPADGLDPLRLASILREADAGDPVRYLELAEIIEERDPHYTGVLGTRKRSVAQIDITVEDGSDSSGSERQARMVRDWLKRDELAGELFDILDALGKGYSHTESLWDTSSLQWMPRRLERRNPRWFRFARHDLATPVMLGEDGQEVPYPPFQFIFAAMVAKSGLGQGTSRGSGGHRARRRPGAGGDPQSRSDPALDRSGIRAAGELSAAQDRAAGACGPGGAVGRAGALDRPGSAGEHQEPDGEIRHGRTRGRGRNSRPGDAIRAADAGRSRRRRHNPP